MLPDPKDVASGIRHLFRSKAEKQQAIERERDVLLRQGRNHIRSHIAHQREMIPRLRTLAKRALALGDESRFRQIGKQIIWTESEIVRWEKYTLTLDMMEARRDQVKASSNLVQTLKLMTDSMAELSGTEQVSQLQEQLDRSLAQTASMDAKINVMMDILDTTLAEGIPADEGALEKLREGLGEEIITQDESESDQQLDASLESMRRHLQGEK